MARNFELHEDKECQCSEERDSRPLIIVQGLVEAQATCYGCQTEEQLLLPQTHGKALWASRMVGCTMYGVQRKARAKVWRHVTKILEFKE